jgi:hypothetical protein
MGFLAWLNPLNAIVKGLSDAYVARQNAQTDQDRIAADERIKALEARRNVLIAESGTRINSLIRAGFAFPFVVYNAKLVLWDKVLALGSTDSLSAELFQIELACIGFYFLYDITARLKR